LGVSVVPDEGDLAEIDPEVLDIAEEIYLTHGFSPNHDVCGLGWANIMAWRQILPL
jgi:hypothetical protein